MLSKELVAASTKPLVLAILAEGESYGYELIRRIRELSADRIQWSEGMLYPFLHWMEAEGLIESAWKESDTGRRRKYYRISRKGGKELKLEREQWLSVHQTLTRLWKTTSPST
jgi:PadR family transcriptional regulator, regulatory protein PadR